MKDPHERVIILALTLTETKQRHDDETADLVVSGVRDAYADLEAVLGQHISWTLLSSPKAQRREIHDLKIEIKAVDPCIEEKDGG